jgi:adenine deaminase
MPSPGRKEKGNGEIPPLRTTMSDLEVSGNIVDVINNEVYPGTLTISDGRISEISREHTDYETSIIPGFIDSHIHIESSMLTPSEFARACSIHGTVAALCDPHEIANVCGISGIDYMIEEARTVPVKFYFSAPSCVPATTLETSGDELGTEKIEELLKRDDILGLGEVMNFPGVLNNDADVIKKIESARKYSKVIDGHAPGLSGEDLKKYVKAGISTNHECLTAEEALENIGAGMIVQIREGSASAILDEMLPLINDHFEGLMFCSDDRHPHDLAKGHINDMVKRSLNFGIDIMKVLRVASVNPVTHYGLDTGLLRVGDSADFLEVDNLTDMNILGTYIEGRLVAQEGKTLIPRRASKIINNFATHEKSVGDFAIPSSKGRINVIVAIDGQLITERLITKPRTYKGSIISDIERDILKIAVINRYKNAPPAVGFVKNFGLKSGAIASSVAHDSHNIVAVGVTDEDITRAVNLIIEKKGGISAVFYNKEMLLPLPIAGIMSDNTYETVASHYTEIDRFAKAMGSKLTAPFMTLSFMSLPVIPELKITDRGLFDGKAFKYIDLFNP